MFASLAGLAICAVVFARLYPSGGLFVLSLETTRLDYEASGEDRAEIWLDRVLVMSDGVPLLVDHEQAEGADGNLAAPVGRDGAAMTVSSHPQHFCYTGAVTPGPGTRVELTLRDGRQFMKITPPDLRAEEEPPKPTFLRHNGQKLVWAPSPPQDGDAAAAGSAQDVEDVVSALLDVGGTWAGEEPDIGDFDLSGEVQISADPDCEDDTSRPSGFALHTPIFFSGPAVLGRFLREEEGAYLVDEDIPYLEGTVEVIISQVLCRDRLLGGTRKQEGQNNVACPRIYRLETDPVPLPPGAALRSEILLEPARGWVTTEPDSIPAPFVGHVLFDEGRFIVNASTEADAFIIVRPGTNGKRSDGNVLSVPFMDRILLEPSLVILASLFFALSGLLLGILQVEDED